jgi:hypothetical protein
MSALATGASAGSSGLHRTPLPGVESGDRNMPARKSPVAKHPVVRYAEFRRLEAQRQEANNAIMALLAGSKLAINTLNLTEGAVVTLAEVFPSIPHIKRFNLQPNVARDLLEDAEQHLAIMAIPYVLALHEAYIKHCAALLRDESFMGKSAWDSLNAKTMHATFSNAAAQSFTPTASEAFELIRMWRNCHIHSGGMVNDECVAARAALSPEADAEWTRMTGVEVPNSRLGNRVQLGEPELRGTLAVTNILMREANHMLQLRLPSTRWARMAVTEFVEQSPLPAFSSDRLKALKALIKRYYSAVALRDAEIMSAAQNADIV